MTRFRQYVAANRKKVALNTALVVTLALLAGAPIYNYFYIKHITYMPTKACDLLTIQKASQLLGDRVINVEKNEPVISEDHNLATSKCGYTDENPDTTQMKIAAVAVRSAITDEGVAQNKADFRTMSQQPSIQPVHNLGQSAFFNPTNGQLNVLQAHRWVIVTYGRADAPQDSTVAEVQALAAALLSQPAI